MSNKITIEFCAEDRDRLDRLAGLLEARITQAEHIMAGYYEPDLEQPDPIQQKLAETLANAENPAEPPKDAAEDAEASALPVTPTEEEAPTAKEDAPEDEAEPTVTLEQIQKKVMQLATGNGGAKKAQVREIINAYGAKVSDLKEQPEKWTEVWKKLAALEKARSAGK